MLTEAIQLESLRQKIEDSELEAGSQSDYLDHGKPTAAQAKEAQERIDTLNRHTEDLKAELQRLITTVRSHQPQALEEWIHLHTSILQKIVDEKATDMNAMPRQNVAKQTLQEWESVRTGEQVYVRINWFFLQDYKESVRTLVNRS